MDKRMEEKEQAVSENPVRSASVKAAKEIWVLKNTSSVPSEIQSQMADIIESKFAPVVAAAKEAMAEKCAGALAEAMQREAELRAEMEYARSSNDYNRGFNAGRREEAREIATLKAQLAEAQ